MNYPDFSLFTDWVVGMLKSKYEGSAINWSWLLMDKYKNDKKALDKFFFYLDQFKNSESSITLVPITKGNIDYSIQNKTNYLLCGLTNNDENSPNRTLTLQMLTFF